jgi:hypothetical protein
MTSKARRVLALFLVVVIAVPASVLITVLLFPLWTFLEAVTGIEAVGHSGPAEWCYVAVFVAVAAAGLVLAGLRLRER